MTRTHKQIRQRHGDVKQMFGMWMTPALRAKLNEIAEEAGFSLAALITTWLDFLAARYDKTNHLLLNPEDWGVEFHFDDGRTIWTVVPNRGRVDYADREGVGADAAGGEAELEDSAEADFAASRPLIRTAAARAIATVGDEQERHR